MVKYIYLIWVILISNNLLANNMSCNKYLFTGDGGKVRPVNSRIEFDFKNEIANFQSDLTIGEGFTGKIIRNSDREIIVDFTNDLKITFYYFKKDPIIRTSVILDNITNRDSEDKRLKKFERSSRFLTQNFSIYGININGLMSFQKLPKAKKVWKSVESLPFKLVTRKKQPKIVYFILDCK